YRQHDTCEQGGKSDEPSQHDRQQPDAQHGQKHPWQPSEEHTHECGRPLATAKFMPDRIDMSEYHGHSASSPQPIPVHPRIRSNAGNGEAGYRRDGESTLADVDQHHPERKGKTLRPEGVRAASIATA